jgi:hypothetical protein
LAFGAFLILSRVQLSDFLAKVFPLFFLIPAWSLALLDAVARLLPQTGYALNSIYSGVGSAGVSGVLQQEARLGETRITGLVQAGVSSVTALCAKFNPVTLISPLYPGRLILLAASFAAIFLSGFRGALLFALAAFLLAVVLRRNVRDLWVSSAVALLGILVLISIQGNILQLPLTMQRALSWLPGDWNQEAVADAEGSSQWRFEMWGWAWNDERILRDRTWGQGFGLSLDDMNLIAASLIAGEGGGTRLGGSDRENFMVTGAFHSGPLSTIKYIGVVGLSLYFPLMCYMAILAWRLCRQAYGSKAFTLSLFVGIPIIYEPFNFVVIFGALDSNYPQLLLWAGLLNMLDNYIQNITLNSHLLRKNADIGRQLELRAA